MNNQPANSVILTTGLKATAPTSQGNSPDLDGQRDFPISSIAFLTFLEMILGVYFPLCWVFMPCGLLSSVGCGLLRLGFSCAEHRL